MTGVIADYKYQCEQKRLVSYVNERNRVYVLYHFVIGRRGRRLEAVLRLGVRDHSYESRLSHLPLHCGLETTPIRVDPNLFRGSYLFVLLVGSEIFCHTDTPQGTLSEDQAHGFGTSGVDRDNHVPLPLPFSTNLS